MTNPSPARPPLVLDEVVAASEEAGDYNAQDQAASARVNCRVALSPEMAIRVGKATRGRPRRAWLSMQAKLDLWRTAGKPAQVEVFEGVGGCLGVLRQRFWQRQMLVDAQPFSSPSEVEAHVAKVECRITAVNGPVMVGAYQGHIFQCISTPATQPVNVVCFAEVPTIHSAGAPFTYLALPLV